MEEVYKERDIEYLAEGILWLHSSLNTGLLHSAQTSVSI